MKKIVPLLCFITLLSTAVFAAHYNFDDSLADPANQTTKYKPTTAVKAATVKAVLETTNENNKPLPTDDIIIDMENGEEVVEGQLPERHLRRESGKIYCYNSLDQRVRGWQQIDNDFDGKPEWYYFDADYSMVQDDWTTDGYYVNEAGRWVESANNAWDNNTKGWKFGLGNPDKMWYNWNNGSDLPCLDWDLIDDTGRGLYYWYYFDLEGYKVVNQTITIADSEYSNQSTKYKLDAKGRWIEDGVPVAVFKTLNGEVTTKDKDEEKESRAAVLIGKDVILDLNGERSGTANVVWGKKTSQSEYFLRQIIKDKCTDKFEKKFEEKEIYSAIGALGYHICKNAIYLPGQTCTIVVDVENVKKIAFDCSCEYNGRSTKYETDEARVLVYLDGEQVDDIDIDEIYQNQTNLFFHFEQELEYPGYKLMTITYNTNLSKTGLIITNGALTKFNKQDEEEASGNEEFYE